MNIEDLKKEIGANDADALRAMTLGAAITKVLDDEPSPVSGMAIALALGAYLRKLPDAKVQEKHLDWLLVAVAKVLVADAK